MKTPFKIYLTAILISFFSSFISSDIAFCQPQAPDSTKAGVVEKGMEKKEKELEVEKDDYSVELEAPKQEIGVPGEEEILVKEFRFNGNKVFKSTYIKNLTSIYLNKELSLKQLQEACKVVTDEYHKQGYFLAKAYLPPQEVMDGVVHIEIIEGQLAKILIRNNKYYKTDFIKKFFLPLRKKTLNYGRLLKTIFILNDYPDIDAKVTFVKSKTEGASDIIVDVEDSLPFHASLGYNNCGSRYVSKQRSSTNIEYGNLIFDGDKLSFGGVMGSPARTIKYVNPAYSLSINPYGTRAGFSYTFVEYDIGREFRQFDMGGKSEIYSLSLNHPLIRSRTTDFDLLGSFDYKQTADYISGEASSDDRLRILKLGASFNHIDKFKGRTYVQTTTSLGIPGFLGGLEHDDAKASRLGAGGEFIKVNLDFNRVQKLPLSSYLILRTSGQCSSDVLCTSEQFMIGGPSSVRGFPQAQHLGDYGYNLSVEARTPVPFLSNKKVPFMKKEWKEFIQLAGFIDHGKVFLKNPLAGEDKNNEITGVGAGIRLYFPGDLNVQVDWGQPIGSEKPSTGSNSILYIKANMKFL